MANFKDVVREKCTLKELSMETIIRSNDSKEMLFVTSYGMFHGSICIDPAKEIAASSLILSDVTLYTDSKTIDFNGTMELFVDQIIALQVIDKEQFLSFLNTLQC